MNRIKYFLAMIMIASFITPGAANLKLNLRPIAMGMNLSTWRFGFDYTEATGTTPSIFMNIGMGLEYLIPVNKNLLFSAGAGFLVEIKHLNGYDYPTTDDSEYLRYQSDLTYGKIPITISVYIPSGNFLWKFEACMSRSLFGNGSREVSDRRAIPYYHEFDTNYTDEILNADNSFKFSAGLEMVEEINTGKPQGLAVGLGLTLEFGPRDLIRLYEENQTYWGVSFYCELPFYFGF